MASGSLAIAQAAASITTIGQLRAAMGAVTLTLSKGYAQLDQISSIAGENKAARDLLDTVNASAQKLYGLYNDDPELQDEEISAWRATLAGQIVGQANDALRMVEDAAGEQLWDLATIVSDATAIVGTKVGGGVQAVGNAVASGLTAFVWSAQKTLAVLALLGALYVFREPIGRALGKAAA